jgi:hypothetical protein
MAVRCVQTAVYWGNPVSDEHGGFTYTNPIEIKCRWEEIMQLLTDKTGKTMDSRALVYVLQDLDIDGMLFLGTLDDLDSTQEADPTTIENAFTIKRFEKIPGLGSTSDFLRKAYLTPSLSFGGF